MSINEILLYVGSISITLWGLSHIIPVRNVVKGFGQISQDNRRIIIMEWTAEGLTLCFIGVLVLLITVLHGAENGVSIDVFRISAVMLFIMASLTLATGARTSILPMKVCPIVKSSVAILFLLGSAP